MKIGLFNDSFPPSIDGVANTVVNYADILTNIGECPVVITPKYPGVKDNYPYKVYRYRSVNVKKSIPYRFGVPFHPKDVAEITKEDFDIFHVHCPFASMVLANECAKTSKKKTPIVFTYHTKFDLDIDNYVTVKPINNLAQNFLLDSINLADEVWAVSNGAIDSLRSIGYTGKVAVMPNGTDFKKGKSTNAEIKEINKKHSLDNDELVFLYCGRMMWYKNIKIIIDGLKKLKNENIDFKMIFIGDGPDKPEIEKYVKEEKMDSFIIFTGAIHDRNEIRKYYSRASLFLFPSTYDTSGLVVKEAAACDCPSVLVKNSCAAEGVTDGVDGILIEENSEDFARKIHEVLSENGILNRLGINAGKNIYYSWEDSVRDALSEYKKIIEKYQ